MKKIIMVLLFLFTTLMLFSCSIKNGPIYNKFDIKFNRYKEKLNTTNQYVIDMVYTKNSKKNSTYVKVCQDPFYIETDYKSSISGPTLITEKDGKTYKHKTISKNGFATEYLSRTTQSIYEEIFNKPPLNFVFNVYDGSAENVDDTFTFTQYYDANSDYGQKSFITSVYRLFGYDDIKDINCKLISEYIFGDDTINIYYEINTVSASILGYTLEATKGLKLTLNCEIKPDRFNMIDVDYSYHTYTDKQDVYLYSNLGEHYKDINNSQYSNLVKNVLKYKLEKGKYSIVFDSRIDLDVKIKVYNSYFKVVDLEMNSNEFEVKRYFEIKEDGIYYFEFNSLMYGFRIIRE